MTTIAYDGKTLAVDTRVTEGGTIVGRDDMKIAKLKDGRYLASSGDLCVRAAVVSWLNGAAKPEIKEDDEYNGLLLDKEGLPWEIDKHLRMFPAVIPWGGGSGGHTALAAMLCGKTPVEAVKIACKMDTSSGLPVISVHVRSKKHVGIAQATCKKLPVDVVVKNCKQGKAPKK